MEATRNSKRKAPASRSTQEVVSTTAAPLDVETIEALIQELRELCDGLKAHSARLVQCHHGRTASSDPLEALVDIDIFQYPGLAAEQALTLVELIGDEIHQRNARYAAGGGAA